MRAHLPTGLRGRLYALALTFVMLTALWMGMITPLLTWYADRAETLEHRRTVLRHMTQLAETLPALQREQEAQAGERALQISVLDGPTDALAGAQLQDLVEGLAKEAGASLTSVETLPAEQRGAYWRIALRIALVAPWERLVSLLAAIEQATPRMLVDQVQLRGMPARRPEGDTAIEASLTISGFRAGTAQTAGR
jgi:general secretion pathway protein M